LVEIPAASQGATEHLLRSMAQIVSVTYGETVSFTYRVPEADAANLDERLAHLVGYQIRPETLRILSVYE